MTDFIDKLAANGVAFTLQDGRIIVEGDLRVGFTLEPEDPAIPCDYIPAKSDRDEHPDHSVGHS